MKDVSRLVKFMISGTFYILGALFVAFTLISFLYYYFHLRQDPMGYFRWWWGHVISFRIMQYILYFIAFEVVLLIAGIIYVRRKDLEEKEEEKSKQSNAS